MGAPYDETTFPERSAKVPAKAVSKPGMKAEVLAGRTKQDDLWPIQKLGGPRRKIHKGLGPRVKTAVQGDY